MTLSTHIAIAPGIPVREVFDRCRALLDTPDSVPIEQDATSIAHPPGVGLPAWLIVNYGPNGPLVHDPCEDCGDPEHDRWIASNPTENGQAVIDVDLDTTYGYRGPNGESCSSLHARLVTQLGAWLDGRGIAWWWRNEYTGVWWANDALGREALVEFAGAHTRPGGADEWFRSMVLPAILNGAPPQ